MATITLALLLASAAAKAEEPAPVLSIEARLFVSRTGQFSDDVLGPNGRGLGNVVIGPEASTATFVVVRVAGPAPLPAGSRVRLVATEEPSRLHGRRRGGPRVILDQSARLPSAAAADGSIFVGFWLADTGCTPIRLNATVTRSSRRAAAEAWLGFLCYE